MMVIVNYRHSVNDQTLLKGKMVNWEPLRTQWEEESSIIEWNYQAFIFEYNLQLVASNWHITQHFEAREE